MSINELVVLNELNNNVEELKPFIALLKESKKGSNFEEFDMFKEHVTFESIISNLNYDKQISTVTWNIIISLYLKKKGYRK
jgi:hypothetical protein